MGKATRHKLTTSGGAKIAPRIKHPKKQNFLLLDKNEEGKSPANPSKERTTGTSKIIAKISSMVVRVLK